jgi:hypothetical protein
MTAAVLSGILILFGSASALAAPGEVGFDRRATGVTSTGTTIYDNTGAAVTDLFDTAAKDLAPGDVRSFTVQLRNTSNETVRFYLKATVPTQAELDALTTAASVTPTFADNSNAHYTDLLTLVQIKVTNQSNSAVLYTGPIGGSAGADLYDADGVFIGTVSAGWAGSIEIEVTIPDTLDNTYQGTLTAVDWVFTVQADDRGGGGNTSTPTPSPSPGFVIEDDEPPLGSIDNKIIDEDDTPLADFWVAPHTGDDSNVFQFATVAAVALVALLLILFVGRRDKKEKQN